MRVEFRAVRLLHSGHVASVFDSGALHSQANPKERHLVLARVLDSVNHSLNAALPEAAGNQDSIIAVQARRGGCCRIDFFGFNPFENGLVIVRQPAMQQGLAQTLVGVLELHIFADNGNARFAGRVMHAVDQVEPGLHVRRARFQFQ